MDNGEIIERTPFRINTLSTESPLAEALSVEPPPAFVTGDSELDVSVFDEGEADMDNQQYSSQPPPLPSLPPPTTRDMSVQGHCVPSRISPDIMQTGLPVTQ